MQGIFIEISIESIGPSPFQKRQRFDPDSLQNLSNDIKLNGLLNPILCRPEGCSGCELTACPGPCTRYSLNGHYELLHGERRWRAAKLATWIDIPSQVRPATDMEARRIVAAENIHREDLTPVELIEATADWIDSCLIGIEDYVEFGDTYLGRVGRLLSILWNRQRKNISDIWTYNFVSPIVKAFNATNRNITWESFYNHDLRPYLKLDEDVKEVAIDRKLPKSKVFALQELKIVAPEVFEEIRETGQIELGIWAKERYDIEEVSARELKIKARIEQRESARRKREQELIAIRPQRVNEDESIILGDCLKVDWPSRIDLIVTDPPFGLTVNGTSGIREGKGDWDEMDYATLHEFNRRWLNLAIANLKEEGSIFVFGTLHNIFSVGHILKELGCYLVRDIVWNKPFVQRQVNLNALVPSHELIIWARKGKRHTCYLDEITRDVWDIQPEAKYGHPTEKPEALIQRIIAMASDPGGLVVDPFLGSGVTIAMAKGLKRRYWGVEKDEQWWKIATQRTRDTREF